MDGMDPDSVRADVFSKGAGSNVVGARLGRNKIDATV